jgi:hypothetical protein
MYLALADILPYGYRFNKNVGTLSMQSYYMPQSTSILWYTKVYALFLLFMYVYVCMQVVRFFTLHVSVCTYKINFGKRVYVHRIAEFHLFMFICKPQCNKNMFLLMKCTLLHSTLWTIRVPNWWPSPLWSNFAHRGEILNWPLIFYLGTDVGGKVITWKWTNWELRINRVQFLIHISYVDPKDEVCP